MNATELWTNYWKLYISAAFIFWFIPELIAIGRAHYLGMKNNQEWTFSDTIRRWSLEYRWLSPLVIAVAAGLMWHFFGQVNMPDQ